MRLFPSGVLLADLRLLNPDRRRTEREDRETGSRRLAKQERECFNQTLRQGCSTKTVGLRDTLEPDPGNTGVGSFRSQAFFFLDSQRESSCFMEFKNKGSLCSVLLSLVCLASQFNHSISRILASLTAAQPSRAAQHGLRDCCFAAWPRL
jgi:hypothetical protein